MLVQPLRSTVLALLVLLACGDVAARAAFPYAPQGEPAEYGKYRLPASAPVPNDLGGKLEWMYASTQPPPTPPPERNPEDPLPPLPYPDGPGLFPVTADARELHGYRGAWVADADRDAPQAWHTTTGRPDVTIAVLDSGIEWGSGEMRHDLRKNTRISKAEARRPQVTRVTATEPGQACTSFTAGWDANGDGVFNVVDYACDARVLVDDPRAVAPDGGAPMLDPQDVLIAFSDGQDDDANGYVDDMVGWDFLDDDNDPFDDVKYGHGTGEAKDSAGEANTGGDLGTCPNCMEIHLRVGTSFVADVNRFAEATIYATDNGVEVVQEALGTLNKSRLAGDAIEYAYDHGTTVIASAADEAAQHHNWPSSYPYSIVVNSVTHFDAPKEADERGARYGTDQLSYLQFNGCTNFSSRITLAIPSVSCSSDATGRAAGMAGLMYSAALNAVEAGKLAPHPTCVRVNGTKCPITPNEIRQLMASGTLGDQPAADDVNFAVDPVTGADLDTTACGGLQPSAPYCTDPFRPLMASLPRLSAPKSYPARRGHDQFYGYGRVNMNRAVDALRPGGDTPDAADDAAARIPPEVELTSPGWYEMVDPAAAELKVRGQVWARGAEFACRVFVAPGSYPKDVSPDLADLGDFVELSRGECNGAGRRDRVDGDIASIEMASLKALFPPETLDFRGPEGGPQGQTPNPTGNVGRPNDEPYGFTVKVVATTVGAGPLSGEDRRQAYLHRDQDMLPGFPRQLAGDVESSPVLADLDGDNRNELVVANSDGEIHAFRRDGGELPGYPAFVDALPDHGGAPAYESGEVEPGRGAVLGTPAIGDLDHDGTLEIVVADLEDKVYVFDGQTGQRERTIRTPVRFTGQPVTPFVNVRKGDMNRTQHGFIASPVLADLDRDDDGKLEIVAASMDRHVYAFEHDGTDVPGWPVLVVDRAKVKSIDPVTHRVEFKENDLPQGAIVDTPTVGDIAGDARPEVVVGTNEEYAVDKDGGLNAGGLDEALYAPLGAALAPANGRLYAIRPEGEPGGPKVDSDPWVEGWPFKVGILQGDILPLVGEGITGSPIMGDVPCGSPEPQRVIGVMPAAGVPYLVKPNGESCYGRTRDRDVPLPTKGGKQADPVFLAAFGHPAFGLTSGGTTFFVPAAGVTRAADVVAPEYQGGQDYLAGYNTAAGQLQPGWPAEMNDLQFLTGPSIGDIGAAPGEEILAASAHNDLQAFNAAGADADPDRWPKTTGDWSVANPTIGTWGTKETATEESLKVVVHGTRNGRLLAYSTGAEPCAAASWPRFHHDLANSGELERDATPPGKPEGAAMAGSTLSFVQPGDDLLCGTAAGYEVRTSDQPITPAGFAAAASVTHVATPGAPGTKLTVPLAAGELKRFVAVRAVDDAGAVGLPAVVDRTPPPVDRPVDPPVDPPGDGDDDGDGDGDGDGNGGGGSPTPTPTPAAAPTATPSPAPRPVTPPLTPAGRDRPACARRSLRFGKRGLGPFRLGRTRAVLRAIAGTPSKSRRRARYWCVQGGGSVRVIFDRAGRAVVVASTARRHRARRVARGVRLATLRRAYPRMTRVRRGMYVTRPGARVVFGLRGSRVRYVAVATRSLARNAKAYRRHLGYGGV